METCRQCNKTTEGIFYHGFCSVECYNTYKTQQQLLKLSPTGMQNVLFKADVHDILKNGVMHGVMHVGDVNFAIVCDAMIDSNLFRMAAESFVSKLSEV